MSTVDVTIIDPVVAHAGKHPTCPTDAPVSLDRVAVLDYAAWHAHVAGTRRWAPGGGGAAP